MTNEETLGVIVLWLICAALSLAALFWVVRAAVVSGLRAHAIAQADGSLGDAVARATRGMKRD
ncbi:hypothetical protein ACF044_04985 [Microbacterium sp. NPDC016588]